MGQLFKVHRLLTGEVDAARLVREYEEVQETVGGEKILEHEHWHFNGGRDRSSIRG